MLRLGNLSLAVLALVVAIALLNREGFGQDLDTDSIPPTKTSPRDDGQKLHDAVVNLLESMNRIERAVADLTAQKEGSSRKLRVFHLNRVSCWHANTELKGLVEKLDLSPIDTRYDKETNSVIIVGDTEQIATAKTLLSLIDRGLLPIKTNQSP